MYCRTEPGKVIQLKKAYKIIRDAWVKNRNVSVEDRVLIGCSNKNAIKAVGMGYKTGKSKLAARCDKVKTISWISDTMM